jgi:omega-amidase
MINVLLIQSKVCKSKAKALEYFQRIVNNPQFDNSDIVCFPELWYPNVVNDFEKEFAIILDRAKQKSIFIIPGAFLERIDGEICVSCPIISKKGKIIGRQLKIHPFGIQRKDVKPGIKAEVFNIGKFKLGVVICYDAVFPEVSRVLTTKGADVLFFPSKIKTEGVGPWHIYLQARALENRIPVVAPNVCTGPFGGRSIIVDFSYNKRNDIALPRPRVLSENQQVLAANIDITQARNIRRERFKDFRQDLYPSL